MIKIDKLLVLKAFYLGYEIRENHFNEAEALKMVNRAIDYYESQNRTFSKSELKRKLFYLLIKCCLLYTSPSPRDGLLSRMPSSA